MQASQPDLYAPDYTIRVLDSDLNNPSINLIERVIWDECEFHESVTSAPPEHSEEGARRSGFVDLLLERTAGLGEKLSEVAGRVDDEASARADMERKVRSAIEQIEALKHAASAPSPEPADRRALDDLVARVEEIREEYAGRAELNDVGADLAELRDRAAERSAVDELARSIAEIKEGAAPAGRVEALARELDELKGAAVGQPGLDALAARIDEIKAGLGQERLMDLETEVARIKQAYAGRTELDKISADLAELRSKYSGRALLDKVHDHLEVAGTRFAERTQLHDALDRISEIASRYADRETLAMLAAAVEEIKNDYAERTSLDELAERVTGIAEQYAPRESLARVKAKLEDLSESAATREGLDQAAARIEDLAARAADRGALDGLEAEVGEIKKAYAERALVERAVARIEELAAKSADRESLASINTGLEEIRAAAAGRADLDRVKARVDELALRAAGREELDQVAVAIKGLRAMIEETRAEQHTFAERQAPAEGMDERIARLEQGLTELNALAAQSLLVTDLESRVAGLEQALRPVPEAAGQKQASAPGLVAALARIAEIEQKNDELGRKLTEALKQPAPELADLRRKLAGLELALRRLPPPPAPRTWLHALPALTRPRLVLVLAVLFLAALAVGTVAAFWSSDAGGSRWSGKAKTAAATDAPNAVYDDVKPPLSTPTLDMGGEWLNLKDGKVDITGYAPGAARAFLYLNNQEIMGTTVEKQGFRFKKVGLAYGVNVIEVKVKDEAGNEANSMAGIVERESPSMAKVRADSVLNRQRGPRELPFIALTIDAGASDQRALKILDVLRDKGIVTTFFLTGQFIQHYPEVVKRIVADGHEVGDHTYNHPHLTTYEQNRHQYTRAGVTKEFLQNQLLETKKLFEDLTGAKMAPYWRAPYGEYNSDILAWAQQAGFKHVDWTRTPQNLDMLDWIADAHDRHYLDASGLLRRLTGIDGGVPGAADGGIILMHLGTDRSRDFMDQILPTAIDTLRSRNYRFVTISRMFSRQ